MCVKKRADDRKGKRFTSCFMWHWDQLELVQFSGVSWEMSALQWEVQLSQWSVTEDQVDLLAIEGVVGALGYGPPGDLLAREGDQGLAAALATEVVQDENGVWLELKKKKRKEKKKDMKISETCFHAAAA